MLCLLGLHRWRWFSLATNELNGSACHISQCVHCRKIKGGWSEPRYFRKQFDGMP